MGFFEKFFNFLVIGIFVITVAVLVIWFVGAIIDSVISMDSDGRLELKTVETECYDENNHLIHELTCEEDVHCSKWGWAASYRCDGEMWNQLSDLNGRVKQ